MLRQATNRLLTLQPSAVRLVGALWVLDAIDLAPQGRLYLNVDSMNQRLACYRETD